jgi:hypothetical protein
MGFSGPLTTTTWAGTDQSWIKHRKGVDTCKSITLNVALFTAGTHFPNGYIPSGMTLGVVTATGLYGPYLEAAGDGRTVLRGFLFDSVYVPDVAGKITVAMFREGIITEAKLPANHGLDANGKLDLTTVWYE